MNMKRILVLVMTLVMFVSAFAPTLSVFAEELHIHAKTTEKTELNYVSLGDSMTNGIGMQGYDKEGMGSTERGSNGFLEVAPDAYPSKFAAALAGYTGSVALGQTRYEGTNGIVNLTQLATSASRAEDLWYLLNRNTENEFEADPWTQNEMLNNRDRWGDPYGVNHDLHNDYVAQVYQDAVKNADVISYAYGNGSFGVFLMGRVMNIVGFDSGLEADRVNYSYMTLENAVKLCHNDEKLVELVLEVYAEAYAYLEENNMPVEMIDEICQYAAYVTASYLVTFGQTMDYIAEVNPDATVIILPLINNALDFNFDITANGITRSFCAGDFLGAVYDSVSAYMAAYTAVKQEMGEYEGTTFLYAELPVDENGETIQVETYAQAFDTLYAPLTPGVDYTTSYPSSRLFCHSRFVSDIRGFVFPILMGGSGVEFSKEDVMAYEIAQAKGNEALAAYILSNPDKAQWIAQYLGVVDAIMTAIHSTPHIDVAEFEIADPSNFSMFDLIGSAATGMDVKIQQNAISNVDPAMVNALYMVIVMNVIKPQAEAMMGTSLTLNEVLYALDNNPAFASYKADAMANAQAAAVIPALPAAIDEELSNVGMLQALLSLYGRLKLAWGLSAHPSAVGHSTLAQSLADCYNNNYTTKDETIENLKYIGGLVVEYYDEAYAYGYQYADENGYIDLSVEAIDKAIAALENVDLSVLGTTDELTEKLAAEIEATIATLKELREVLATDSAKDVEGLAAAVLALEDDLYTHLNNIGAILTQAGIDVNNLVILPALAEAIRIIEEEVIPAIIATVEAFVQAVVDHVKAQLATLYNKVLGITEEAYNQIIEALVKLQLQYGEKIENAIQPIVDAYFGLVATLVEIYGSIEEAIRVANQIVCTIKDAVVKGIELYDDILNILINTYGIVEDIVVVAAQIFSYVYDFVSENLTAEQVQKLYNDVKNIVIAAYGESGDAYYVATQVYAYLVNAFEHTFEGDYHLTADSLYVALGNAVYGEELAEMLNLSNKYFNYDLGYYDAEQLAEADLVTVRFDNGETFAFAFTQFENYGEDLDWSKYLDAEGQAALDELLETIKANLIANGAAAELTALVAEQFPGVALTDEFVADVAAYVVESAIYAYAELMDRVVITLENVYEIAPNATVVITGIQNPLNELDFGFDLSEYTKGVDLAIATINAQLVMAAFANENTIFVNSVEAADIYDALNVHCDHVYDNCADAVCNICAQTRVAPGHMWHYVANNDASCLTDGTETAKCSVCGLTDTRTIEGSALGHDWKAASCLEPKTCTRCGTTDGEPAGHSFGEWVVKREATHTEQGFEERICSVCGLLEARAIPMIPGLSPGAITGIVIGGVVVVAGIAAAARKYLKKNGVAVSGKSGEDSKKKK